MEKVQYTMLNYYPNIGLNDDCLTLGILYYNQQTQDRKFVYVDNFQRLKQFDDEIDTSFIKMYLEGIKDDVENIKLENISFNVKQYTKFFVNNLSFGEIIEVEVESFDNFVDESYKVILRLNLSPEDRPTKEAVDKFLWKRFRAVDIEYKRNEKVVGKFDENISFSYCIGRIGIKIFQMTPNNLSYQINHIKSWFYNVKELKDQKKVIFVYDFEGLEKSDVSNVIKLLKSDENIPVYDFNNFIQNFEQICSS